MNNIYVDELPKSCRTCSFQCYGSCLGGSDILNGDPYTEICHLKRQKPTDCPLKSLTDRLAEERKRVVSELKVDIRSLFNAYASSLLDYCIWNKNADENQKLYNNFKRIINDRLDKVLDLFDKRIDQIERNGNDNK